MPSPVEKLQKFLNLEKDRGYDNRAVVGGLDKIVAAWKSEAEANNLPQPAVDQICSILGDYAGLDSENRARSIQNLLGLISEFGPQVETENTRVQHRLVHAREETPDHPQRVRNTNPRSPSSAPAADQQPVGLNASLTVLPGIGVKNAQYFKQLGIETLGDLLFYFPRRYDDYSQMKPINRLEYGEVLSVMGTVKSIFNRPIKGGKMTIFEAVLTDGTGSLRVTWFNQPWLEKSIKVGDQIIISGKVDIYLGRLCMNSPEWEAIDQERLNTNRIVPVYSLTANVSQRMLRRAMQQTVSFWASRIRDFLPDGVRTEGGLARLQDALQQIHFPDSENSLRRARERLAFDEIFLIQLGVLRQKMAWQSHAAHVYETPAEWVETRLGSLPFELTGAQKRAIGDIHADLVSGRPMNRLLQGDVGSGKTIVAAMAVEMVARHGVQSALMAPTSILAGQHYRNLVSLYSDLDENNPASLRADEIGLLLGDTPETEKQAIRERLKDGSIKLIIGTHALLQDPIEFQNLQLTIIDEQHRFGVSQRAILRSKGDNPHLLVMTATPIPRSLALTIYGDLDLSIMDEMPPGRQPVETHIFTPIERERAYTFIRSQVKSGRQAFIVYPLVDQGENEEALAAVQQRDRLSTEIFPGLDLGLLHGKLKPDEKDNIMRDFRDGKFPILVATSVIEVGVDVPNASVMLIEGANRFGLAQLHQLRGRVGRGQEQSYCILIPDKDDAAENERLKAMEETNDGFVLAERDLDQRGPGEFLGTRQAGFSELRLANLSNLRLIEKARNLALKLFTADPTLEQPENSLLVTQLDSFWSEGRGDIS